jgi:hypothetical protein
MGFQILKKISYDIVLSVMSPKYKSTVNFALSFVFLFPPVGKKKLIMFGFDAMSVQVQ